MKEDTIMTLVIVGLFTPVGWMLIGNVFGLTAFVIEFIRDYRKFSKKHSSDE